jgi:hypothetical protein
MNLRSAIAGTLIALTAASALAAGTETSCSVHTGPRRTALVELYTSEGCSSCPPADRDLGRLDRLLEPDAVAVPVALHVDYWDGLGWKDRYAQPAFSDRHHWLVRANHHSTVYTPHFFVDGRELRSGAEALREAVRRDNQAEARASIQASIKSIDGGGFDVDVAARSEPGVAAALYLAVAENGLASDVTRGENRGERLQHDHVVRRWIGPLALNDGGIHDHRVLAVSTGENPAALEVVAFVEDAQTGEVLQALGAGSCPALLPPPLSTGHKVDTAALLEPVR